MLNNDLKKNPTQIQIIKNRTLKQFQVYELILPILYYLMLDNVN